jgi:PncC family amidohydrolase
MRTKITPLGSEIGKLLKRSNKSLSVAESCTGGLLSSLITDAPGSSGYYVGGLISYGNRVKTSLLGVNKKILGLHGAVSRQTAREMARRARRLFRTDLALGVTGIAGPAGGSRKKPVGLVHIALAYPNGVTEKKALFRGTRLEIKFRAAHAALELLRQKLLGGTF